MIDISNTSSNQQQTIGKPVSISGIGLHTGTEVNMKLYPAKVDYGIKFIRKDIKDNKKLTDFIMLKQNRLSVLPVSLKEWDIICKMAQ